MVETVQNKENDPSKTKLIESNLGSNPDEAGAFGKAKQMSQVPVTAAHTKQLQKQSNQLYKQSRSSFDKEFLKAIRNSKSAPPNVSAQMIPLEIILDKEEGSKGRAKTGVDKKDLLLGDSGDSDDESETMDGATAEGGIDNANNKADNSGDSKMKDKDKFDPSTRLPLWEEFPSLSAEEIQTKLENTWTQVSMTLLTRPQFQSQRERVTEWLQERGNQNPITTHPIVDII